MILKGNDACLKKKTIFQTVQENQEGLFTGSSNEIYALFANYLRMKINDGSFPKGSMLPTVMACANLFRISRLDVIKAEIKLEMDGLVSLTGWPATVVGGMPSGLNKHINVRNDIEHLFRMLDTFENEALESAWPHIDRDSIRKIVDQAGEGSVSTRIWQVNAGIHAQIVGHCHDDDILEKLSYACNNLEFFRRAYLEEIAPDEALRHVLAIESIIFTITAQDLWNAHINLSTYLTMLRDKVLSFFSGECVIVPVQAGSRA